ncbi:hypothetical protein M413DRAFT_244392 [Hebeloma cylindrosporum]|uniref:Uncharacterized protein n=1 Tax=Hebeloma cylindrosporum TaxID=76867 RepID=A0A0C2XKM4_HEBCY|nr:hypothetical protein M413DRAFT_244392 [Hebeloma cylindrosporum h7]
MRRDYPVEETGDFQRAAAAVGLDSAPSSNEAGPSDQAAPTNTTTESALGLDINPPPAPRLPFVPPPPPPPLPNSVSNSNALPNRLAGSSVPLVPVRRASQGPTPVRPQPSSGANPVPESYRVGSATTPRASLYPPRQGSYGSTAPIPFSGAPTTPTSYATQPYQLSSTSAPQTFASPLPMSSYMASPAPTPYQSPAAFPPAAPFPPRSQRPSTSLALQTPYSSYGSSSVNYPSQPIPGSLGSQRPATTTGAPSAPQTPASQSMYGTPAYSSVPQRATISSAPQTPGGSQSMYGKSPAYGGSAPQQSSARPQSYGGPTTPGAPLLPYANLPQQPIIGTGPITPGRRKTDAFVANDPFRPQHSSKHNKRSDDLTFDDIPVAGATVVSQPWTKYDSAAELPTAPYPSVNTGQQQTQPPPSVSWRPNQPSTYDPHQSSSNPPLTHPGSSQYPQASQPIYNRPSSATTSPMPYGGSPQYQPRPQAPPGQPMAYPPDGDPMGTSSPAPTGQPHVQFPYPVETAPQPTGPPAASSSNTSLEQPPTQPTPEPVMDAPGSGDSERPTTPVSRPSTPGDRPSDAYPPPRLGYPEYDPYDSSTFPGPPPIAMSPVIFYPPDAPVVYYPPSEVSESGYPSRAVTFVVQTMPREVYLHFLLRLPSLYFSRVARIFEEADLTLPEIKKMALETASQGKDAQFDIQAFESNVPPQYERLKSTWEAFIDSVMREWKTFNIISVLLLSAILTILQIQSAADDPLTRYFAVFSLICSLISLLFGCMYIIRFGSMRKTYKAAEWALVSLFGCCPPLDWVNQFAISPFSRRPKNLKRSSGGMYGFCWRCPSFGLPGMCIYHGYVTQILII